MEKNVCGADRLVRAVLGVLLLWNLFRSSRQQEIDDRSITLSELLTVYAIAELSVNVFAQWCPANALLGINTCQNR
ncbi:YgaP family membrane protein [Halorarum salinum]|uniref:DUF2892 domain-containing protein n=1 Tax=Halorarum salinum TaxID=2743089 RepID=A0A7D5QI60_9EURY|nr:DUF2892 domain-containing protein [Halobaculum salinum]QLG63202.1 DUF2892 domain-containing protein [Halobaculum salinum]